jgi:hypothetical protein
MAQAKKLQNYFSDFLPQNYRAHRLGSPNLNSNQAVVAELLRLCCEGDDVKAIKMAFERILGKPERVIIIKRTLIRTVFPDARQKALKPIVNNRIQDETAAVPVTEDKVVIDEADAPGALLKRELESLGEAENLTAFEILDNKDRYTVAQVMVANLYAIAMKGGNLGAIDLLFNYLDGAVADVIRLDGEQVVLLESWADVAPYEAVQDENGTYYIETEGVK